VIDCLCFSFSLSTTKMHNYSLFVCCLFGSNNHVWCQTRARDDNHVWCQNHAWVQHGCHTKAHGSNMVVRLKCGSSMVTSIRREFVNVSRPRHQSDMVARSRRCLPRLLDLSSGLEWPQPKSVGSSMIVTKFKEFKTFSILLIFFLYIFKKLILTHCWAWKYTNVIKYDSMNEIDNIGTQLIRLRLSRDDSCN